MTHAIVLGGEKHEYKDFPKFVYRFYLRDAIRHCIESYLYTLIYSKVMMRKMIVKFQLKGDISEPSSEIPKLYAIGLGGEKIWQKKFH